MKRLRKKKSFRDKIWFEQDQIIHGQINEDGNIDIKKTMSDYINEAPDIALKEVRLKNEEKKRLHEESN